MDVPAICPECGWTIAPCTPMGLCPRCVLRMAMNAPPVRDQLSTQPDVPTALPQGFKDYEVLEEIGRGGMGVVYRARQKSLNREVSLKMILGGRFADAQALARFRAEAETTAHLQHPNLVAIHEVGEHEGLPYLVMDYVAGRSLAELARERPLPARSAATYLKTIAEAIAYAHSRGVLHRDLKPSNVLIDGLDQPRITDFGLAKRLSTGSGELTVSGQTMGSPNFMAPEQATGERRRIGPAVDIYGLGATLYYLITGRPPFVGETISATARQVVEAEPVAPRLLNPRLPRDLETICLKCLEKEPGRRYGTASELAEDLGRFLRDEPIRARPAGWAEKGWRWCRRRPALAAMGMGVLLLALVASVAAVRLAVVRVRQDREFYYASIAQAQSLIQQGSIARAREVLLNCPEEHRHWEWGHLIALCHQEVLTIPAATNVLSSKEIFVLVKAAVKGLSFDGSGQRLGTLGMDGSCKVWEVSSGRMLWTRGDPTNRVESMVFHPSEERVALVSNNGLAVCSSATGEELNPAVETSGAVLAAGWGPKSQLRAAIGGEQETRLLAADPGQPPQVLGLSLPPSDRGRFTPDGERLLLWGSNAVVVIGWADGKRLARFQREPNWPLDVAVDPEGRRGLGIDPQRRLQILSPDGSQRALQLRPTDAVPLAWTVTFSPDGRWCCMGGTGGNGAIPQVIEMETGQAWQTLQRVHAAAFSPDGDRLVVLGGTLEAILCNLPTRRISRVLRGHEAPVDKAVFSPDGRLVATADQGGVVKLWSARAGRELFETAGWTWPATYSHDGRMLSFAAAGGPLYVCDAESGRRLLSLQKQRRNPMWTTFSPDGRQLAMDDLNGEVWIWDLESAQHVRTFQCHDRALGIGYETGLAYSPDGRFLATGSQDRTVRIWDAKTGNLRHTLEGHSFWIVDVAFSPDGRRLATSAWMDPHVGLWDVESGAQLRWWSAHPKGVLQVRFTPDGRQLATSGYDNCIRMWDVGSGRLVREWPLRGYAVPLDFSPDGRRLVAWVSAGYTVSQDVPSIHVWDPQQGRSLLVLQGHTDIGGAAEFHPNGRRILTISCDQTVRQWEAFPWRESDYPSAGSEPLADRIRRYADAYWQERLAAETLNDQPEGTAGRVVFVPFDRVSLPRRVPGTPPHLVDLTEHYTGSLRSSDLISYGADYNNDLRELQSGRVQFGETEFDIRGIIRLKTFTGPTGPVALAESTFPDRTGPIAVGRLVHRLHVLGGVSLAIPLAGTTVARLTWRYADGRQSESPVLYGQHLRSLDVSLDPASHVPAGRVAWTGSSPNAKDFGMQIRLYHFTLDNPRPDAEVTQPAMVRRHVDLRPVHRGHDSGIGEIMRV